MAKQDPYKQLAQLTERQQEVLKRVCKGLTYKSIADELVVAESTVKAHMGNIYQKLNLDELPPNQRTKIIFEVFCPALSSKPPKPKTGTIEPDPVPEQVSKMVDEDEKALLVVQPRADDIIEPIRSRPLSPFVRLGWLVSGFIVGIILMGGLFAGVLIPRIREQTLANQVIATAVVQIVENTVEVFVKETVEIPVKMTVLVSETPEPTQPLMTTSRTDAETENPTLSPTLGNTPTPTEPENTAQDSVLEIGEWWKHEGVWLKISEVEFDPSGYIEIRIEFWNKTGTDLVFDWSPTGNFSLTDNTNHQYGYEWYSQSGVNNEVVSASDLIQLHHVHYGSPAVTFEDNHFFDTNVTALYFTVNDLSRVPLAIWHIVVPK